MSERRLDATAAPVSGKDPRRFTCLECGCAVTSTAANAEFCATACRKAWNNRRAMRGAEIYDFMMVLRYDRGRAKALRLWTMLCRLVALFRDDDWTQREGRRSWSPAEQVMERKAFLHAIVVQRRRRA